MTVTFWFHSFSLYFRLSPLRISRGAVVSVLDGDSIEVLHTHHADGCVGCIDSTLLMTKPLLNWKAEDKKRGRESFLDTTVRSAVEEPACPAALDSPPQTSPIMC